MGGPGWKSTLRKIYIFAHRQSLKRFHMKLKIGKKITSVGKFFSELQKTFLPHQSFLHWRDQLDNTRQWKIKIFSVCEQILSKSVHWCPHGQTSCEGLWLVNTSLKYSGGFYSFNVSQNSSTHFTRTNYGYLNSIIIIIMVTATINENDKTGITCKHTERD